MIHTFFANFNTRLCVAADDAFNLSGRTLFSLNSDSNIFKINPVVICADPFLITKGNRIYLFYEYQKGYYSNGEIKMIYSQDLKKWSSPQTVLKESFHLSFPFVFKEDGSYFMIPETNQDNSIRLYKTTSPDLDNWGLECKIINDGNKYVDTSIIKHNDVYYLFTTLIKENEYYQCLFYSSSLTGKYIKHPQSPVFTGKDYGRNGGSIFKYKNKLYRPAQNCDKSYGKDLSLLEIKELTREIFSERLSIDKFFKQFKDIYKYGGHQFNFVVFMDKYVVATDTRKPYWNIFRPFLWILNKLVRYGKNFGIQKSI